MEEQKVNPILFGWIIKTGTAILTFMTGIIVYLHRKVHFLDTELAVNKQADKDRDRILKEIKSSVTTIESEFKDFSTKYNDIVADRNEMSEIIKSQEEVMSDYIKIRKIK